MKTAISLLLAVAFLFASPAQAQWGGVLAGSTPANASSTAFTTAITNFGSPRNDGGGYATGFNFTVGGASIVITHLGRWKSAGDSSTHVVSLLDASNVLVTGGQVTIDMSNPADPDGFVYAALASPPTISASTVYSVSSVEVNGVDHFFDATGSGGTTFTHTAVANVGGGFYVLGGSTASDLGGADHTFGPVTFKYR